MDMMDADAVGKEKMPGERKTSGVGDGRYVGGSLGSRKTEERLVKELPEGPKEETREGTEEARPKEDCR